MKKSIFLLILIIIGITAFSQETYPNGHVKSKGNKQNGEYITYHENGQIMSKGNRVNGEWDGEYIEYENDGQIKTSGKYINGKKDGNWR